MAATPVAAIEMLTVNDLASGADRLDLGPDGVPRRPLLIVDLDQARRADDATVQRAVRALGRPGSPTIGVCRDPWSEPARRLAPFLDLTLTTPAAEPDPPQPAVAVDDVDAALGLLITTATGNPRASASLCQVLRITPRLAVPDALVVESLAYSMLLAGPEFRTWREQKTRREPPVIANAVRLERGDDWLTVTLDHPARRNAFSRVVRDGLVEAFELVAADPSIRTVVLEGAGPAFCSGGDLDEFGTMTDVTAAHLVRLRQGAAAALDRVADRVTVHLHGACIGAGIEIPSFAGRVVAAADTMIQLPELAMGLIPGAGGTVGLPRRIGRWRAAWLALSAVPLSADAALRWGLVDELVDHRPLDG